MSSYTSVYTSVTGLLFALAHLFPSELPRVAYAEDRGYRSAPIPTTTRGATPQDGPTIPQGLD